MFWKKQWKKFLGKDGKEQYEIPAYSKDGGHIKSLERQGGLTTSASYGGMGVRELQLRMELLVDQVLSTRRSVFEPAKVLASFAKAEQDRFLDSIDEENWDNWIDKLLLTYKESGHEACLEAIRNVDDYLRSFSHAPSTVTLHDISRILESFVVGLDGRKLTVELSENYYTDTESIRVPEVATQFSNYQDNFSLYKAMVVHQWAQTRFGTWRMNVDALVRIYKDPIRALSLFHKLETIRLNARIKHELPGIARIMKKLDQDLPITELSKNWSRAIEKLSEPDASVQDSMYFLETVYKDEQSPEDKIYQGSLQPREVMKAMRARSEREKESLADKLADLQLELSKTNDSIQNANNAEQGGFSIEEVTDESMPDGFKVELKYDDEAVTPSEDIQQLLESILQDFGEIPSDYLETEINSTYDDSTESQEATDDSFEDEDNIFLYDEWDHSRQKYRKDWCHLKELPVQAAHNNFVKNTLHKHRGLLKNLHKTFEALREDDKRMKRQPFGDDIDLDAVVEAYADTKIGIEASQNLFTKSRKTDRNIAVMFMIDMSGSTSGWINDMEREALVLLCESLEILGDRYAIYGFSGVTHKRCELYKIKELDEEYNQDVKARISGIKAQDYTRMGVAIRHLTKLLHQVEARTKLLITLSDGRPDDQDGYRGPYGIEDTRRALIEAKYLGIHPFCITIDKEAMDYLQHMYGAVNFAVIDNVDKLPYKVSDIYRRITI